MIVYGFFFIRSAHFLYYFNLKHLMFCLNWQIVHIKKIMVCFCLFIEKKKLYTVYYLYLSLNQNHQSKCLVCENLLGNKVIFSDSENTNNFNVEFAENILK